MGRQFKPGQLETGSIYNISSSFAITASYALNAGGTTIDTGSLITTASFNAFTASYTTGSFTGSFSGIGSGLTGLISSSYATTASYVNSLGSSNYTQSFSNSDTWIVTHNLGTQFVIIQTYDSGYDEMIPQNVDLTDANTATITFPTLESGYVVASVGGALSSGNTYNTYTSSIDTGSFATTGSNTFNGSQTINGQLSISGSIIPTVSKSFSLGSNEFPFRDIYISSGSLVIASDDPEASSTTISNVSGNILISAGGMQLVGSGSFNAATGSFGYISGSLTQVGDYIREGNTNLTGNQITTGSVTATAGFTGSLLGTASYASNGGVTQLLAGPNITLSPTNGLGQVTITSTGGGSSFNTATGSYGSFYDTTTQTNVANTPRSMSLNTTDITNGVSISGSTNPYNTYIKTVNAGIYDIQFSAQVEKTDAGIDKMWIWLRKNGVDLTDTSTAVTLEGNNTKYVAAWNWFVNAAAGDYFQLMWYSADANIRIVAESATANYPGIPSLIVTADRVDQFLSNTGSFTGNFTGNVVATGSLMVTGSLSITGSGTINNNDIVSSNTVQKIETISSASYALLSPPTADTLYIIIG